MRKEVGFIGFSASILLVVTIMIGFVQVVRYRQIQTSQLVNENQSSSDPVGLIVALNAPAYTSAKGVMVNYLSPQGVAVRSRPIPNTTVKTAHFQVVQDDVFVYTEQGDEPGLRRMDESGSLSAGVDIHRGVSGDDFWLVSSDGVRVAWSETTIDQGMTASVLFTAQIDGSDKQQVVSVVEAGEFYLRPVAWMEIEPDTWKVWYVKQSLGLEGEENFSDPLGPIFSNGQIVIADQAVQGTWSPDKKFVAEAVRNPDAGWLEIRDVTNDKTVKIPTEVSTDIFHIVGWLNSNALVLAVIAQDHPFQSKIYVVNADGSFFRKVWDGFPIGVVPAVE